MTWDDTEYDPAECVGGLCPPHKLPTRLRSFDHCVWSRAPGEIWWRRRAYCQARDAGEILAMYEGQEPDTEVAVRPNDQGAPE
jgi:hypothetical protein